MNKTRWRIATIINTLVFAALACAAYIWFIKNVDTKTYVRWRTLGTPPEMPTRIVGLGSEFGTKDVYVETATGTIFHCCKVLPGFWDRIDNAQNLLPAPHYYPCNETFGYHYSKYPSPPGEVVDCAEESSFEWVTNDTFFVLLADGSVWRLHYQYDLGMFVTFVCGRSIVGMVIGYILSILVKRTVERRVSQAAGTKQ